MRASAGALSGLALAACGSGSGSRSVSFGGAGDYDGPPVELQFWNGFTGGDGPQMLELIDEFGKEHPKIDVSMVTVRWEDFYQKVPAAVSSGVGPDIGIMHVDQLSTSAAHGAIVPLDDLVADLGLQERDFAPDVWRAGKYRGRRYGVPLDMHPLGLYANTKVLEEAGLDPQQLPRDRAEYEGALIELKAKGIRGSWMSPFLFTGGLTFQALLYQFGGTLTNEDATRAAFDSDAGVEALEWLVSLRKRGFSPSNVGADAEAIAFKNGDNAFIWTGSWGIADFGSTDGLEWKAAPLPKIGSERAAWSNSHNFVVMVPPDDAPEKLQASRVFIDWITRQAATWAKAGMIPARKSARADPEFRKLEAQQAFAEEIPYVRFAPSVPGLTDVRESTLDQAIAQAVNGAQPARQALEDAARRADELLLLNVEKYEA